MTSLKRLPEVTFPKRPLWIDFLKVTSLKRPLWSDFFKVTSLTRPLWSDFLKITSLKRPLWSDFQKRPLWSHLLEKTLWCDLPEKTICLFHVEPRNLQDDLVLLMAPWDSDFLFRMEGIYNMDFIKSPFNWSEVHLS